MNTLAQAYQDGWNDALRTIARRMQLEANDLIANPPTNPYAPQYRRPKVVDPNESIQVQS